MTQPHYIDRAADIAARLDVLWLELNDAHSAPPATARILNAMHDASHLLKILSAPMEAVAWREKVARIIEDNVEAERRGPGDGWLEVVGIYDAADAILALIATHPVQGGEG